MRVNKQPSSGALHLSQLLAIRFLQIFRGAAAYKSNNTQDCPF